LGFHELNLPSFSKSKTYKQIFMKSEIGKFYCCYKLMRHFLSGWNRAPVTDTSLEDPHVFVRTSGAELARYYSRGGGCMEQIL